METWRIVLVCARYSVPTVDPAELSFKFGLSTKWGPLARQVAGIQCGPGKSELRSTERYIRASTIRLPATAGRCRLRRRRPPPLPCRADDRIPICTQQQTGNLNGIDWETTTSRLRQGSNARAPRMMLHADHDPRQKAGQPTTASASSVNMIMMIG